MKTLSYALFIVGYLRQHSQAHILSDCHPYPGAVAQDCLTLIGENLNNDTTLDFSTNNMATLSCGNCRIVTVVRSKDVQLDVDTAVRRALTVIGKCALSDFGSISGSYTGEDGAKTCYLYPGQ